MAGEQQMWAGMATMMQIVRTCRLWVRRRIRVNTCRRSHPQRHHLQQRTQTETELVQTMATIDASIGVRIFIDAFRTGLQISAVSSGANRRADRQETVGAITDNRVDLLDEVQAVDCGR